MSEEKDDKVEPVGFKKQNTDVSDKRSLTPFVIPCSEQDLNTILREKRAKVKELTAKLDQKLADSEAKAIIEEIREVDNFINKIEYSSNGQYYKHDLYGLFEDKDRWTQAVLLDEKEMACRFQRPKTSATGEITSKEQAKAEFGRSRGVGQPVTTFLPDSMIRVTVGNISEKDVIRLMNQLAREKGQLGFNHKGSFCTATDAKINCIIIEFCLKHVIASTLRDTTLANLMEVFVVSDMFALAAATLASMYPKGYPYLFSCIDSEKCGYKAFNPNGEDVDKLPGIDYSRMTWYDWRKFTPARHRFLRSPNFNYTVEQVLEEQEIYNKPVQVGPLNSSGDYLTRIKIKKPHYLSYREQSYEWIADITSSADEVLNETSRETSAVSAKSARTNFINQRVYKLNLMKHRPWIIEVQDSDDEDTITATTPEAVEGSLEALCSDEEIAANIDKIIQREKNKMATTMTGLAQFECPKCNKTQVPEDSPYEYTSIVPRSVISDFFYIMELKALG